MLIILFLLQKQEQVVLVIGVKVYFLFDLELFFQFFDDLLEDFFHFFCHVNALALYAE